MKVLVPLSLRNRIRPHLRRSRLINITRKYELDMPTAAVICVGDSISISEEEVGSNGRGPFQQILMWVDGLDGDSKSLANRIARSAYLPGNLFRSVIEDNRQKIHIANMYQLLHRGASEFQKAKSGNFRTLIVAINPQHSLPILVRMIWPQAKIICVFTRPTALEPDILIKADAVLANKTTIDNLAGRDQPFPLMLLAEQEEDAVAGIKAFIQTSGSPSDFYFFSIRGKRYEGIEALSDRNTDIILLGSPDLFSRAKEQKNFLELIDHVLVTSDDVLINSKWLYQLETLVAREDWAGVVGRILAQGGRSIAVEA